MSKILISACLLGQKVRYDGGNCCNEQCDRHLPSGDIDLVVGVCHLVTSPYHVPNKKTSNHLDDLS